MLRPLLTNFELQKCYQNKPKFDDVYSRNDLTKVKDGTYIINPDDYESIETHWIALYANEENGTYFDRFWVEHIPKEIRNFIGNKNVSTNIYRIQVYNSIMCKYFCIGFIDFMLNGKNLLDCANLFSPNEHTKNDKKNIKIFSIKF